MKPLIRSTNYIIRFTRTVALLLVGLAPVFNGCSDPLSSLADAVRKAGTAEQWHAWAADIIKQSRTNSSPPPESEWPEFARQVGSGWRLLVHTNDPPEVALVRLGGFQSLGLIIGQSAYVETNNPNLPIRSRQVYPGIYVRESH